jgi:DNA modification methylase
MASSTIKVPYTQQFAPATTPLHKLLAILRQKKGNRIALRDALASAFFGDTNSPEKMAANTLIALKFHGIIDDNCNPTLLGNEMLGAEKKSVALGLLAKNILLKLDGLTLIETLREMQMADAEFTLGSITDELRQRGFEVSDNSSDLSGVLNWLRAAGVLTDYKVNEDRYAELAGASPKAIEALKDLTQSQIAFIRALLAIGTKEWIEHNKVVEHAEALYSGQVSFGWKELDRTVLQPLVKTGLIEFRKAPKTDGGRGGKPAAVRATGKFEKEVADPILEPMYRSAGYRDVRKIRSIPLAALVNDIKGNDDAARGKSLEILAIRICQLLDLDFMGWRETDDRLVGGGEVDGLMHTARLVYSRWQIQCKASDKIVLEAIAKEVGVSEITLANVILIVSTGTMTGGAKTYRQKIISKSPLNIVVIDGHQLDVIVKDPAAIVSILKEQAQDAMRSKPQSASLVRKAIDGGAIGGGGTDGAPGVVPNVQSGGDSPNEGGESEPPKLFKSYYATAKGSMYLGDAYDILRSLIYQGIRVKMLFTSPPFALIHKKAYGNEDQDKYVAWFMRFAPLFQQILEPNGSFVMDIGGSWLPGIPARSTYQYKLMLKLCDSGFYLNQEFYHYNPARLPSPAEWVTIRRIRVKDAINNVWWFGKQPFVDSSNLRILNEYSASMRALLKNGYKAKLRPSGHDISTNFKFDRGGSIPSNMLQLANTESNSHYLRECKRMDMKPHPARFPIGLPNFFIKFLTQPGDLILDPFAGSNVTGESAELLGRRWIGCEISEDYVKTSQFRFTKPYAPQSPAPTKTKRVARGDPSLFQAGACQEFGFG